MVLGELWGERQNEQTGWQTAMSTGLLPIQRTVDSPPLVPCSSVIGTEPSEWVSLVLGAGSTHRATLEIAQSPAAFLGFFGA